MSDVYLAHSANRFNRVDYLREHLKDVAALAQEFASVFGASAEANVVGLLHDIGKYGSLFQKRLENPRQEKGIDHWSAGAWIALMKFKQQGIAAALAIQGHHVGLQQLDNDTLRTLNLGELQKNHPLELRISEADWEELLTRFHDDSLQLPEPQEIHTSLLENHDLNVAAMLDIRMLFSALVDADFLATEAHFQPAVTGERCFRKRGLALNAERDWNILSLFLDDLSAKSDASLVVKRLRADLLQACIVEASRPPGLFTLTAPTGTGKTLSMLAFALKHALVHGLRRIVVVVPYLSIIEQTVSAYRTVFQFAQDGSNTEHYILEHHSLAGTKQVGEDSRGRDDDMEDESRRMRRLLAENWDAPIVVTTNVQFLESLFANRSAACRKLHRLARSVILFDEVQTFSVDKAIPTLAALSRLVERYDSTVVLSTATQPAFRHLHLAVQKSCKAGWQPKEIVSAELRLFERAKRTTVEWSNHPISWSDLADRLAQERQLLCIVNLKRHALTVYRELKKKSLEGLFHMSTDMCPAHRTEVLKKINMRLNEDKSCRLISTQCVEAGVDIDFPTVFRALGPFDAIAQAAGRCNRKGNFGLRTVHVFLPDDEAYPQDGAYSRAAQVTRMFLNELENSDVDIHSPGMFHEYYCRLYDLLDMESQNRPLKDALNLRDFTKVADLYRIIDSDTINVLVPYDHQTFQKLRNEALASGITRHWIAKARPYTIGMFRPKPDHPLWLYLEAVPLKSRKPSGDWFVYFEARHYSSETGLVVPSELSDCLIA
ncbi:CRISPR-associated helicase/endonuclease Cas3 [Desulfomonile tiedjei]|uniref:CRISPR-associated helicase Cas3/CRISPR-associated endonuclease Cas3-HD n=1 Tax=Desulfomonile tiedjei (strain ATCC 49306 / DSM 6799 / DCB-1) TaxID=706587 RepID=I4C1S7_DESTA|nr:CRISPR-associated helicase/endonuclease Cas3 [Desulfomonile tiedjei]AFM23518.1 CRISPR-associated helicase Cas3/CRISPR-associated endonuclease Cas3-HD [Desulfomonile tiedjei DSM 6799]